MHYFDTIIYFKGEKTKEPEYETLASSCIKGVNMRQEAREEDEEL